MSECDQCKSKTDQRLLINGLCDKCINKLFSAGGAECNNWLDEWEDSLSEILEADPSYSHID